MLIRLFDFLNAYPYQAALQAAGIPYRLYPSPRAVWEAWKEDPGDAALLPLAGAASVKVGLSRWGIASLGPVRSVLLLSDTPTEKWNAVEIDDRSLSSVAMINHLMRKGLFPRLPFLPQQSHKLPSTARLLIGDEALQAAYAYPYRIDIGEIAYHKLRRGTVFAIWWALPKYAKELGKLWRRFLPARSVWIEEAGQRYGFSPDLVREYWRCLRYRLPRLGTIYWKKVFQEESESLLQYRD
ncbi:MAG: hypothetical protein N2253_06435 [Bacteroidia bacterium]|nr:hypothetical protein [Bacteroidia bacterium]MCX7764509.1 hypothetical protein [Bacteroidia bacterium]MDW8056961.1 MqnA/MqnD/SBP family protein [Bacteroidia bacterium]